jgi:hypothetical protein
MKVRVGGSDCEIYRQNSYETCALFVEFNLSFWVGLNWLETNPNLRATQFFLGARRAGWA